MLKAATNPGWALRDHGASRFMAARPGWGSGDEATTRDLVLGIAILLLDWAEATSLPIESREHPYLRCVSFQGERARVFTPEYKRAALNGGSLSFQVADSQKLASLFREQEDERHLNQGIRTAIGTVCIPVC